jgi:hypothetical protein
LPSGSLTAIDAAESRLEYEHDETDDERRTEYDYDRRRYGG